MISLKDNNSLIRKVGFLFMLVILLQIPMFFINRIIDEREYSYRNMVREIGNEWGEKQTIAGAFLIIPYSDVKVEYDEYGKKIERNVVKDWILLPDKLNVKVDLKDEVRKRGIYKTTVYSGDIILEGEFPKLRDILPANLNPYNIGIGLGITDTKSLMKVEEFKVEGKDIYLESGTGVTQHLLNTGISGTISENILQKDKIKFSIKLSLRGNGGIEILPFGKENHFEISSTWKSPSFYGILPSTKIIDENGFKAQWDVSFFVRNYKQDFAEGYYSDISEGKIGVDLYEGVTHYRQVMRAVKYSMLFVMLSLFVVYIFEVTSKRFTHYIQYGVVGFSLTLFYLVLLSMSEYFNFNLAYIIATLMVVIPNSLYIKAVTKNKNYGLGMLVFLSGVYAVLYSILKMEQYALMTGTLLLMLVLYVMMYITRNIEISQE
ncbi:cell envelope integrity protein CreD [Fusobacterium mortiferum]|jgi:inner membrane protein|uniref:cell envelope integrity protein CreD n=1 Tax=Fusobacterium mortiferum TaxID=850 RepID=UPI000E43FA02|nr:cell envelope integrity protein CreD [Fusobacterium mortiferum]MCF2627412.1 cell envelope integrity protein CreD [Fusobacterium mortiferum]MCF2698906.1 cell envelope integrity protein CreD [Fusobacterium mortiferum]MDY4800166.1 cell envelope integrity protein CreD [Fusobacterium mortiferum]RGM96245.1 cell envelope integrity protein CreD [Fusobacterium mortiferum]